MATQKSSKKIGAKLESAVLDKKPPQVFRFRYTTGPFYLPQNSGSLDWILMNNDTTIQEARVTIFKCPVTSLKMASGPFEVTVEPGKIHHNANEYEEGFPYEVQVECNSRLLFPYVCVCLLKSSPVVILCLLVFEIFYPMYPNRTLGQFI